LQRKRKVDFLRGKVSFALAERFRNASGLLPVFEAWLDDVISFSLRVNWTNKKSPRAGVVRYGTTRAAGFMFIPACFSLGWLF
jgi:hypothetical protein